jgi:hypothetical protein
LEKIFYNGIKKKTKLENQNYEYCSEEEEENCTTIVTFSFFLHKNRNHLLEIIGRIHTFFTFNMKRKISEKNNPE